MGKGVWVMEGVSEGMDGGGDGVHLAVLSGAEWSLFCPGSSNPVAACLGSRVPSVSVSDVFGLAVLPGGKTDSAGGSDGSLGGPRGGLRPVSPGVLSMGVGSGGGVLSQALSSAPIAIRVMVVFMGFLGGGLACSAVQRARRTVSLHAGRVCALSHSRSARLERNGALGHSVRQRGSQVLAMQLGALLSTRPIKKGYIP